MRPFVAGQGARFSKGFARGLLACVRPFVPGQVVRQSKGLATVGVVGAHKGPLARVRPFVAGHTQGKEERIEIPAQLYNTF